MTRFWRAPSQRLRSVNYQGDALRLGLMGMLAGVMVAAIIAWSLSSQLFGISAFDPGTFLLMAGGLVLVTVAASCIPAWRATRVNPVVALRYE